MHSSRSLLPLLPLPLLLLLTTTGPAGALPESEKLLLLEAHNFYRSQTNPPAANMLKMLWDDELAAFAKKYAQQCVWAHNPNRGQRGENLFAITGDSMDVKLAVAEWNREFSHYNFTTGSCEPGMMCGHYTQVVWANSGKVGCDTQHCAKLQNVEESDVYFLVCNYAPPGNFRNQKPYKEGQPCSDCPTNYFCENSLCEPNKGPEEPQDLPFPKIEAQTSMATEASSFNKPSTPSSPATKAPTFVVTEVSTSLATKSLPTVQTDAPPSLEGKDSFSMATEAPPISTTEGPSSLTTHSLLRPVTSPKSTHVPFLTSTTKVVSRTTVPSTSPVTSLYSKMSLTGTLQPLSYTQEKALPGESSASVFPIQDEPDKQQTTFVHLGHTSSRSLPQTPNNSSPASALGGRTLALQSFLPDKKLEVELEHYPNPTDQKPEGWNPAGPNQEKPKQEEIKPIGLNPVGLTPDLIRQNHWEPRPNLTEKNHLGHKPNLTEQNQLRPKPNLTGENALKQDSEESNPEKKLDELEEDLSLERASMKKPQVTKKKSVRSTTKPHTHQKQKTKHPKPHSASTCVRSPLPGLLLLLLLVLAGIF